MIRQPGRSSPFEIGSVYLAPFMTIVFGLAWGLFALFIFTADWVVAQFGALSGHHPLFILAVYAPAIAALLLVTIRSGFSGLGRFLARLGQILFGSRHGE